MGPQRSATPLFYTCNFPGCPSPVRVSIALAVSLEELVRQTEGELQGLLYGRVTSAGTEVQDCRPVANFGRVALGRPAKSEREVVGYYHVRKTGTMRLDDIEVAIADSQFAQPGAVVLLIQRREGEAHANFFFRDNGSLVNVPLLTFPLNARTLEQRREELPAVHEPETAPVGKGRRIAAIVAAALVLVAGGAAVWTRTRASRAVESAATTGAAPLPLRAERQGQDLKIAWDLNAAPVASAVAGVLDIDDGGVKRRIPLDGRQVRNGSVLYTPVSQEVAIDFTAVQQDGSASQASVLAILPKAGAGAAGVQNVAVTASNRTADRTAIAKLPAPALRAFVPPASDTNASAPVSPPDPENLPVAQLEPRPLDGISLPPSSPPARPAPPAPAPAPVVSTPAPVAAPRRAPAEPVVIPPQILFQAGVRVPQELRGIHNRSVTVNIIAKVDKTGKVLHAEAAPQQKVLHIGYVIAATEAALRCTFRPARRGDTPVPSEALLTFKF